MPPIDATPPNEVSQTPQFPQQITSQILLRAAQPDGTYFAKPKLPQVGENVPNLSDVLNREFGKDVFRPVQGPSASSSEGGTSARATTRGEQSLDLAQSIDYARDNFAKIDKDNDGRLSLGEVQGALRKAEGTSEQGKLGAVFSNFEKLSKSADFSIFDSFKSGIDMQDLNLEYQRTVNRGFTDRSGQPASEAMHRHQLYRDTHDGKLPMDDLHEASAWLLGNMKKYDSSRDGVLNKAEIVSSLQKETDPKARQMLQVLNENYDRLRNDRGMLTWLKKEGISSQDAQEAMRDIEQKRGAYDMGQVLLANGEQLFNALDSAKNGRLDGKISANDLKAFIAKYEQRNREGKPAAGLYSPENVSLVREMLGQWELPFNAGTPLAQLSGLAYTGNGPTAQGFITKESVRDAVKI
ncbi:MAG: hypothetical protein C0507_17620 [Cyanobacteria bacterium PR.3.49]|nr:hypothetical protein [Cyanobacteria bacterium PR.3.49]